MGIKWEDRYDLFGHLEETQLFHMARNPSMPVEYRVFAVEMLLKHGHKSANHPELAALLAQINSGTEFAVLEVVPEPEPEVPVEEEYSGPLKASVTTVQKMDEIPEITPADEAPTTDTNFIEENTHEQ